MLKLFNMTFRRTTIALAGAAGILLLPISEAALLASRHLPYEDEVASSFRQALETTRNEKNLAERLKKAIETVTPALQKQNKALSTPRFKPETRAAVRGKPSKQLKQALRPPEPPSEVVEENSVQLPPNFPRVIIFEKGKPVRTEE